MDKKDKDIIPSNDGSINWSSLGFFSADDYIIYIFKKTEKIASALYLVSGLLKDEEPIKWELRDKGMDLLSSSFNASNSAPSDKSSIIFSLFASALETISLLNVARVSNLISEMNHKLLVAEIDGVITLLKDRLAQNAENAGYILSEKFFNTGELYSSGFRRVNDLGKSMTDKNVRNAHDFQNVKSSNSDLSNKKNNRQESILSILKSQSNLTIKDFSSVIKDCSEKTIQRELSSLVDKGIVKKEGNRRWSRYSII